MIRDNFDDCYIPEPNSGCWLWLRYLKNGYGQVCLSVHNEVGAHVFSWERANRPLRPGECVLHRCDVQSCVNPDHLYVGTKKDNAIDMARRKRQHMQKLSSAQVIAIKLDQRPQIAIAREYGVNPSQICRIKQGRRHTYVT